MIKTRCSVLFWATYYLIVLLGLLGCWGNKKIVLKSKLRWIKISFPCFHFPKENIHVGRNIRDNHIKRGRVCLRIAEGRLAFIKPILHSNPKFPSYWPLHRMTQYLWRYVLFENSDANILSQKWYLNTLPYKLEGTSPLKSINCFDPI